MIRTAWIFGKYGNNFVLIILNCFNNIKTNE
ncbi:hypothetical protein DV723_26825 [Klebsiella pneumoniae]|nr:hypothetical protein [Klebsiella pneumoniae]MBC4928423.1 hypothetical protein [Klebsiella quasipneumoniae]QER56780.1 hypothetical protein F2980_11235 [Klebsiella quasipneumoniae subsp. quasipneumoniae]THE41133.1 hypothetical protein DJ495_14605 [Raoultella ornithinolytica]EIW8500585.1 hypothetical protein [Klebsiella pneumoniae]